MTKNISVIDTQGNIYEATYPKRAKGLVKKGRARFVDDATICLARPPYHTEDKIMEDNKTIQPASESGAVHLDEAYVIAKIEQIMAGTEFLRKSLEILENGSMNGDAVMGISNMIEARERTNQEMISLLRHIVNCRL